MVGQIFFKHREVAVETLWWMMSQGDRYKIDKVQVFDYDRKLSDMADDEALDDYAGIEYRYFKDHDDYAAQEYARHILERLEADRMAPVAEEWTAVDPDDCNLLMLDVIKMTIQLDRAFAIGAIDDDAYDLFASLLDSRVADICSAPPGPSSKLVSLFETYVKKEDDSE